MKFVEIKTSMLYNLVISNHAILSCFLFFFLIVGLYVLIPAVIAQIFNLIAELVISKGISSKETKAEREIHPVTKKAKKNKVFNII